MSVNEKDQCANNQLRVAIIYTNIGQLETLKEVIECNGMEAVVAAELGPGCLEKVDVDSTNVILVDLDDNWSDSDIIDALMEESDLPILFNDYATTQFNLSAPYTAWWKKLAKKIITLSNTSQKRVIRSKPVEARSAPVNLPPEPKHVSPVPPTATAPKVTAQLLQATSGDIRNIWVLGASLGGPLAVREFLSKLPAELPIAFILAQHIGVNHIDLLAEQLNRITPFEVMTAKTGHKIAHQQVILTPIESRLTVNNKEQIVLHPLDKKTIYTPSIDMVMTDIAKRFGKQAGAIIFSGMGNDGEQGAKQIFEQGGIVWAQDAESCIISSMPDNARATGCVSFSATPMELAQKLTNVLVTKQITQRHN
jgi:chemosensory pili system protein ChpB (putative protein-glutamate methylesterase)